ncbi:MAG: magnesium transporter CorA family protein [Gemmobacter sp.]|uniref:magnesium transporter CorA family protein n=1 Tax=Gemmobacter sp. TaxID=1898957 RepID=UPI003918855F
MLYAYVPDGPRLARLAPDAGLASARWIDLYRPLPAQVEAVAALGIEVPTLADMEEIELSNRLYRDNGMDFLTVVLPGKDVEGEQVTGPVTFILTPDRLVTVRHHDPQPFSTYPERAQKVGPGITQPEHLFLSLVEEIIGRQADLLESVGRSLDGIGRRVYRDGQAANAETLQALLMQIGRESELVGRVRLGLLTMERAISYFGQALPERPRGKALTGTIKGLMRDIKALEVHADFLSSRVAMVTEVTLGMINLSQNQTIKIVSVVAVVFLPPTVIASAYGMNFANMPELEWTWGYPMALGLMLASAVGTFVFFKWRKWL